jgi:hypothetical protein
VEGSSPSEDSDKVYGNDTGLLYNTHFGALYRNCSITGLLDSIQCFHWSVYDMSPRSRIIILISIMTVVAISVGTTTIAILYRTALNEEKNRLVETVKSQASLIKAIARFDAKYSSDYPKGAQEATLSQIIDAYTDYEKQGITAEFTLSKREGNKMVFILIRRNGSERIPSPIPFRSTELAEPMRLALSGLSGTVVGLDYRGETVLAAHEPISEMGLGIVAKIDMTEIRAPFIKAGLISGLIGVILVVTGVGLFMRVSNPLIESLYKTIEELKLANAKVKILGGFLPICASCKKIRDDNGYWNQIESYIKEHSEAEFSHGICPKCVKKLYPDLNLYK